MVAVIGRDCKAIAKACRTFDLTSLPVLREERESPYPPSAMDPVTDRLVNDVLTRCDILATFSESPRHLTRTFLSAPMGPLHETLAGWMEMASMTVRLDAIGNLIGHFPGATADAPVFLMGSHLDTVPDAGRYDGMLGVLLAIAAVQSLNGKPLPFAIDVLAFSEEEGVRFRASYLGSTAVCGCFDRGLLGRVDNTGMSMEAALRAFGLDPERIATAAYPRENVVGYLEAHIEQGPILEQQNLPLGVVEAIVGQTRATVYFEGKAGHAGTQPMELRRDALVAAAEFIVAVDRFAREQSGLRATVGAISALPGAGNVVPGSATLSLDVRHADDAVREAAISSLFNEAVGIGARRGIGVTPKIIEAHAAVSADRRFTELLLDTARAIGHSPLRMVSGAGHDAAIMARLAPMAMLFLRSPGGISHHPDEAVLKDDVAAALDLMAAFLRRLGDDFERKEIS